MERLYLGDNRIDLLSTTTLDPMPALDPGNMFPGNPLGCSFASSRFTCSNCTGAFLALGRSPDSVCCYNTSRASTLGARNAACMVVLASTTGAACAGRRISPTVCCLRSGTGVACINSDPAATWTGRGGQSISVRWTGADLTTMTTDSKAELRNATAALVLGATGLTVH